MRIFDTYEGTPEYLSNKIIEHILNPNKPVENEKPDKNRRIRNTQTSYIQTQNTTFSVNNAKLSSKLFKDGRRRKGVIKCVTQMYELLDLLKITYSDLYYKRIENSFEMLEKYTQDVEQSEKNCFNYMIERSKDHAIEFIDKVSSKMYPKVITRKVEDEELVKDKYIENRMERLDEFVDHRITSLNFHLANVFNKTDIKFKPGAKDSPNIIKLCKNN